MTERCPTCGGPVKKVSSPDFIGDNEPGWMCANHYKSLAAELELKLQRYRELFGNIEDG